MNILNVVTSPLGNASQSIKLGNAILEKIQQSYPNSVLKIRDLNVSLLPHLTENQISSIYTPAENRSDEQKNLLQKSDETIAELFDADIIIISTPMYNFGIPSSLKAWIDHIARGGVTFRYSATGAEGLVKNKKAYLAISTGAVFSEGPYKAMDFTEPYLKAVLGFIGITDVTTFRVEGIAIPGISENAVSKSLQAVSDFNF
jgi:FMN-dependent NADH-azoreductase